MDPQSQSVERQQLQKRLYARFRRPLLAYFQRRVGDRAEAEDLTQDVFVRLLGAAATLDRVDNVDAFVFKIASNLLHDRGRRAMRQSGHDRLPLDDETIAEMARDYVEDCEPERVLLGREALKAVLGALDELDQRTRNIFVLSRLENMKHRDIAVLYGIAVSTVEKHVMRAMMHLVSRVKLKRR